MHRRDPENPITTRTRTYLLTLAAPGEPALHRTVGEPQVVQVLDDLHRGGVPAGACLSVTELAGARRAVAVG